jgi:hypothetical protein
LSDYPEAEGELRTSPGFRTMGSLWKWGSLVF